jgi:hypothetical protein
MHNFAFRRNRMDGGGQMRIDLEPAGPSSNFTITDNAATGVNGARDFAMPAINIGSTGGTQTNLLVANNVIPSSPWNHDDKSVLGVAAVFASGSVRNLQVRNNDMPLTYGWGVSHTYNQVLPLYQWAAPPALYDGNAACGNSQGPVGDAYYSQSCTEAYTPPPLPDPPAPPSFSF